MDPQATESLTASFPAQDNGPKEDAFAAITENNNTGTTDIAFAGSEGGVTLTDAPVNPEAQAEEKMMELRQRIAQAQAQAQTGGENTAGVESYEAPTDSTNTEPGGVSEEENLEKAKAYAEAARNKFLAEQNIPKKQSFFANIISAPARVVKQVKDTFSSALNWAKAGMDRIAEKIVSLIPKSNPPTSTPA